MTELFQTVPVRLGLTKYGGKAVLYESQLLPGSMYVFSIKKPGAPIEHWKCSTCSSMKLKNRSLPAIPFVRVSGGKFLDDPDRPLTPHYCTPANSATVEAFQVHRETKEGIKNDPSASIRLPFGLPDLRLPELSKVIRLNGPKQNRRNTEEESKLIDRPKTREGGGAHGDGGFGEISEVPVLAEVNMPFNQMNLPFGQDPASIVKPKYVRGLLANPPKRFQKLAVKGNLDTVLRKRTFRIKKQPAPRYRQRFRILRPENKLSLPLSTMHMPLNYLDMPLSKAILPLSHFGAFNTLKTIAPGGGGLSSLWSSLGGTGSSAAAGTSHLTNSATAPSLIDRVASSAAKILSAGASNTGIPMTRVTPGGSPVKTVMTSLRDIFTKPGSLNQFTKPYSMINTPLSYMNLPFSYLNMPLTALKVPFMDIADPFSAIAKPFSELMGPAFSTRMLRSEDTPYLQDLVNINQPEPPELAFNASEVFDNSTGNLTLAELEAFSGTDLDANDTQEILSAVDNAVEIIEEVGGPDLAETQKLSAEVVEKRLNSLLESEGEIGLEELQMLLEPLFQGLGNIPELGGLLALPSDAMSDPMSFLRKPLSFMDKPFSYLNLPLSNFKLPFSHVNLPFGVPLKPPIQDRSAPGFPSEEDFVGDGGGATNALPPSVLEATNSPSNANSFLNLPLSEMNFPFATMDLPLEMVDLPLTHLNLPFEQLSHPF